MKKSELKQLIKESIRQILKEEIKEFKGKRYKKQSNGKWVEVSMSHGLAKQEHEKEYIKKKQGSGAIAHLNTANSMSDKEYDEEELTEQNKSTTKTLSDYEHIFIDLGQMVDDKIYNNYLKNSKKEVTPELESKLKGLWKKMNSNDYDEETIKDTMQYKFITKYLTTIK